MLGKPSCTASPRSRLHAGTVLQLTACRKAYLVRVPYSRPSQRRPGQEHAACRGKLGGAARPLLV
eukprot:scaffold7206_cov500-Prasinococcus_capsulatus_cf.AAC.4